MTWKREGAGWGNGLVWLSEREADALVGAAFEDLKERFAARAKRDYEARLAQVAEYNDHMLKLAEAHG